MHVVTFYSYKGGVGRTMALVNVAALLAQEGRHVLVVDFDLEAPGVPSYVGLSAARGKPGIVDYVHDYIETGRSPDASDYIVRCDLEDGNPIWVMPAGDNTRPEYSDRFAEIEWGYLYEHQSGYDLMNDLRTQWTLHPSNFDYVLVDSRTGNTDIAGICTRQLPDTVVTMFVPTEQNVNGLVPIIEQIRRDATEYDREVSLLFCPSNIPDMFDEDDILGRSLSTAASRLGYGNPAELEPRVTHIHHWTNMELLDQPLVVLSRGQTKLAKEYRDLKTSIIEQNPADREGALAALDRMPGIFEAARNATKGQAATKVIDRTVEIARLHEEDGEIAMRAAKVFSLAGEYEQEERSLSDAVLADTGSHRALLLRAVARLNLNKKPQALKDLREVLSSPSGTAFEFRPAVQLLGAVADDPVAEGIDIFTRPGVRLRAKISLSHLLMRDRRNHDLVADGLLASLDEAEVSSEQREDAINAAMLALIGSGRFEEALKINGDGDRQENVATLFNTAIALWGAGGDPPIERFAALDAMLAVDDAGQNLHQCTALVRGVVGRTEDALAELQRSEERISPSHAFSCWTFSDRSPDEFLQDLREMKAALQSGRSLKPAFLEP